MAEAASTTPLHLLHPAFLRGIGSLELIARQVMEGFISGKHKSPYKGFSSEFAEHREYTRGDDIKDLDWRVYAKSDRYYIKQYEDETNLRVYLLVDVSGSMAYGEERDSEANVPQNDGTRRPGWFRSLFQSRAAVNQQRELALGKFRYVQYLSACLSYLMLHQSDAVSLITYDKAIRKNIPPRSRANHMHTLLGHLAESKPGSETGLAPVLHEVAERIRRRGLVVILSDFFDDPEQIFLALRHLQYARHEIIVMHVMHYDELYFPFTLWSEFRNLEDREDRLQLDPPSLRQVYLERVAEYRKKLVEGCGRLNVDYCLMNTAEPLDRALRAYLAFRAEHSK